MPYTAHHTVFIDPDSEIGENTTIWHFSHIMTGCRIGEKCNIGQNCVVSPNVVLGNNVKIQNNVSIYSGVTCEDDVFIGPSVVFTNILNPRSAIPRRNQYLKTEILKGASIGANSTILCGITLGQYSLIGAGSVVTRNVKDFALIVGNPGKQVGWVSEYGHKLIFNSSNTAVCPEEKSDYVMVDGLVKKVV